MMSSQWTSPYSRSPVTAALAFVAGREAGEGSDDAPLCPHASGTDEQKAWDRGFRLGRRLREEKDGGQSA
jgi:hypothetical protein